MGTETGTISRQACLDNLADRYESGYSLDTALADAFWELRDSTARAANVHIFTDLTVGHSWLAKMWKTANSSTGFKFAGLYQQVPCSPLCTPRPEELLTSEKLHIVHQTVARHIAETANSDPQNCPFCQPPS